MQGAVRPVVIVVDFLPAQGSATDGVDLDSPSIPSRRYRCRERSTASPALHTVTGAAKVTGPAERAAIETSISRLRSGPQVASVSDPFQSGLGSKNGQVALAMVSFTAAADAKVTTAFHV